MTQFAISLGVFRVNRSCKPANPAFTMSEILQRTRPRKVRQRCASKLLLFPSFGLVACRAVKIGGADRDRTDDLKLAKLPLSQLSYGPDFGIRIRWWARNELNVRPHAYQACALTT
jgi:hypothetical protein